MYVFLTAVQFQLLLWELQGFSLETFQSSLVIFDEKFGKFDPR